MNQTELDNFSITNQSDLDKLEKDNFNYLESQENLTEQLKTLESKFDVFVEAYLLSFFLQGLYQF